MKPKWKATNRINNTVDIVATFGGSVVPKNIIEDTINMAIILTKLGATFTYDVSVGGVIFRIDNSSYLLLRMQDNDITWL